MDTKLCTCFWADVMLWKMLPRNETNAGFEKMRQTMRNDCTVCFLGRRPEGYAGSAQEAAIRSKLRGDPGANRATFLGEDVWTLLVQVWYVEFAYWPEKRAAARRNDSWARVTGQHVFQTVDGVIR